MCICVPEKNLVGDASTLYSKYNQIKLNKIKSTRDLLFWQNKNGNSEKCLQLLEWHYDKKMNVLYSFMSDELRIKNFFF